MLEQIKLLKSLGWDVIGGAGEGWVIHSPKNQHNIYPNYLTSPYGFVLVFDTPLEAWEYLFSQNNPSSIQSPYMVE